MGSKRVRVAGKRPGKHTGSNRLFHNQFALRCPTCLATDRIAVAAVVWVRLTRDGADASASHQPHHEWKAHNSANCGCGFGGIVADFHTYQCEGCKAIHNRQVLRVSEECSGRFCECGAICRWLKGSEEVKA